jgi:hypothetical protein
MAKEKKTAVKSCQKKIKKLFKSLIRIDKIIPAKIQTLAAYFF